MGRQRTDAEMKEAADDVALQQQQRTWKIELPGIAQQISS
jgi:ABC-type proline/glycine betaine transport system permease subunit